QQAATHILDQRPVPPYQGGKRLLVPPRGEAPQQLVIRQLADALIPQQLAEVSQDDARRCGDHESDPRVALCSPFHSARKSARGHPFFVGVMKSYESTYGSTGSVLDGGPERFQRVGCLGQIEPAGEFV